MAFETSNTAVYVSVTTSRRKKYLGIFVPYSVVIKELPMLFRIIELFVLKMVAAIGGICYRCSLLLSYISSSCEVGASG
jgi:hypothetical protein